MSDLFRQGVEALKLEDKVKARKLLAQAVKEDPKDKKAWLWLSQAVEEEQQQIACFRKVLEIDPQNEYAKRGLQIIRRKRQESLNQSKDQLSQTTASNQEVLATNSAQSINEEENRITLQQAIEKLSKEGWSVVNQTESSVQLRRPKQWSKTGLVLFVLIPLLLGCAFPAFFIVALFSLLFMASDYLLSKEELKQLTVEQLAGEDWSSKKSNPQKSIPLWVVVAVGLLALCGLSFMLSSTGESDLENEPRTVSTQKGTFSVPGNGFIDGRDVDAVPALTIMEVRVRDGVGSGRRAVCKIPHGTAMQILDVKQDPDVSSQWYHFQVQSGSCKGWVTWWFVSTQKFEPVGERIYDN